MSKDAEPTKPTEESLNKYSLKYNIDCLDWRGECSGIVVPYLM